MCNFTFDAHFRQWYIQFLQKFPKSNLEHILWLRPLHTAKIFVLLCFIQLTSSLKEGVAAYCTVHHPWLSRIPAPVGSQEVFEHTPKLAQLIGRCLSQCRLGIPFIIISDPTCTTIYYQTFHIPIVRGVKAIENSITSCNPMGAGILDNPG